MGEQLDYAMSQGDDGFVLGFILMNLFFLVSGGIILYCFIRFCLCFRYFGKKGILIAALLIGVVVIASAQALNLKKTNDRPEESVQLDRGLKQKIKSETKDFSKEEIIDYSVKLTASLLEFSKTNGQLGTLRKSHANCVGYAKLCSAICNYAFYVNNVKGKAKQVVGYVYMGNVNLCGVCSSIFSGKLASFTKDHDFVEIENTCYVDPCAYDLIGDPLQLSLKGRE